MILYASARVGLNIIDTPPASRCIVGFISNIARIDVACPIHLYTSFAIAPGYCIFYQQAVKQYYKAVRFTEYSSAISIEWKSDDIEVTAAVQTGWTNTWGQHGNKVSITIYFISYAIIICR